MTDHAPTSSLSLFFAGLVQNGKPRRIHDIKLLFVNRVLRQLVTCKDYSTADRLLALILTDNLDGAMQFLDAIRLQWTGALHLCADGEPPRRVSKEAVQALNRAIWTNERFLAEQGKLNADVQDLYDDWLRGNLVRIQPHYADKSTEEDADSRFELQ